jgi:biotin carboxylase
VAAQAQLYVLAVSPLPAAGSGDWRELCSGITECWADPPRGEALVDVIVAEATAVAADAILCFSEYLVLAVAQACQRLGLRGPGPRVRAARNKLLMREAWAAAGIPVPRFRRVDSQARLAATVAELSGPVLFKPAWGSGSIGQVVIRSAAEVPRAWSDLTTAVQANHSLGLVEWYEVDAPQQLLVEEIVNGSAEAWYDRAGYGDYLSVEGIVVDGRHHPICICGRLPTIPPFTELSSNAPSVLPSRSRG